MPFIAAGRLSCLRPLLAQFRHRRLDIAKKSPALASRAWMFCLSITSVGHRRSNADDRSTPDGHSSHPGRRPGPAGHRPVVGHRPEAAAVHRPGPVAHTRAAEHKPGGSLTSPNRRWLRRSRHPTRQGRPSCHMGRGLACDSECTNEQGYLGDCTNHDYSSGSNPSACCLQ